MANGTLAASQIEMLSLSGTGIITITPPATNTNRAITLPDAAGALVVSGTTPSLNGVTFPATQSASAGANTLDDYEEGTWTPTLTSFGGTGLAATGYYTKIGRVVSWFVNITGTNVTSTANTSFFTMPFTAPSIQGMGTCVAVNTSTVSYGVGVAGGTTIMQPPTWAATSSIYITGVMTTS